MSRPASYRDVFPEKRCAVCRHNLIPHSKGDFLCFFGDQVEVVPHEFGVDVLLDGQDVGCMEGDEYDEVWGGRVIHDPETAVCDKFEDIPKA